MNVRNKSINEYIIYFYNKFLCLLLFYRANKHSGITVYYCFCGAYIHTYIHTTYIHLLIIIKHTCAAVLPQRKIRDFSAPSSMFVCVCVLILDVWMSACVRALSCMCVPIGVCMLCECVCLFRFLLPFPV